MDTYMAGEVECKMLSSCIMGHNGSGYLRNLCINFDNSSSKVLQASTGVPLQNPWKQYLVLIQGNKILINYRRLPEKAKIFKYTETDDHIVASCVFITDLNTTEEEHRLPHLS